MQSRTETANTLALVASKYCNWNTDCTKLVMDEYDKVIINSKEFVKTCNKHNANAKFHKKLLPQIRKIKNENLKKAQRLIREYRETYDDLLSIWANFNYVVNDDMFGEYDSFIGDVRFHGIYGETLKSLDETDISVGRWGIELPAFNHKMLHDEQSERFRRLGFLGSSTTDEKIVAMQHWVSSHDQAHYHYHMCLVDSWLD